MSEKVRTVFFSEERRQETFVGGRGSIRQRVPKTQTFFGSFFQKRIFLLFFLIFASCASAQLPPILDQLHRADGAQILPDRFLREWDPITILFPTDRGPTAGGPEDAPARFVKLDPLPPGAWRWLGPRTLQFRPAEAWTPLKRITVTTSVSSTRLIPLLPVPVESSPADTPSGMPGLDSLALTFSHPVEAAALARLMTIEIAPQARPEAGGHRNPGRRGFLHHPAGAQGAGCTSNLSGGPASADRRWPHRHAAAAPGRRARARRSDLLFETP